MTKLCAVVLLQLGMSLPAMAAGTRMGVVVQGAGAGSDKPAGFVAHYVLEQLRHDERYEVVDVESALGSRAYARAQRAFHAAEELTEKGRTAYESLDLDQAVEHLNNALGKYEQFVAYLDDMKPVAELLMLLGATHILRGEERLGSRRLGEAVTVYPAVEPDPRIFNPAMRKVYDQVVAEVGQRARGSLALSSNPSYARVYVDGRFVGVAPLASEGLIEGQHYVRMVRPGYVSWGEVAELPGQMEISELGTLKPTAKLDNYEAQVGSALKALESVGDADGAPVPGAIGSLGALLGVDALMLAEVRLDGERVQVVAAQFDLKAGHLVRRARQVFAYDSRPETYEREVRDMIDRNFSEQGLARTGDEVDEGGESGGGVASGNLFNLGECVSDDCRSKQMWTLVGAGSGVALAGIGVVFWSLASQTNYTFLHETEQTDTKRIDELRSTGKRQALLGDLMFTVGLIGAGTAATMFFVWVPREKSDDAVASTAGGWDWQLMPLAGGGAMAARLRF